MIAVMGASGNTGRVVAENLLRAGEKIRVIGRSEARLAPFAARGAESAVGDILEASFLDRAFRGADGVYAMIPPDYTENEYLARCDRIGEAISRAVRDSGVKRIVFLSSLGAELPEGTGPIVGLHRQEERLSAIPSIDLLILRPGFFFENHLANIELIKSQGVNGGAIAPDVPIAMIATREIGEATSRALVALDFRGTTIRELLGQRDLSMREATRILGTSIGKADLPYVQFPYSDYEKALAAAGIAPGAAALFSEMARALSEGRIRSLEGRHAGNTTPTSLEDFAETFARAYHSA